MKRMKIKDMKTIEDVFNYDGYLYVLLGGDYKIADKENIMKSAKMIKRLSNTDNNFVYVPIYSHRQMKDFLGIVYRVTIRVEL